MSTWVPSKKQKPEFQKHLHAIAAEYSRRRLGLAAAPRDESSELASHRAACGFLKASEFHPTANQQVDLIAIIRPADAMALMEYEEDVLREAVARFCAEFFALAVDVRKERWEQLWSATENLPALRWRLDHLRTALSIPPEKLAAVGHSRAAVFTDPFVMSPEHSAQSGRTAAASLVGNRAAIAAAARTLKDDRLHCAELAQLKPSCGVTTEQRLQWLGARAKHKLPVKSWILIITLLLIIAGAFGSIPFTTTRIPGGGQPIPRNTVSNPVFVPQPRLNSLDGSPEQRARFMENMSPELRRALLGPEEADKFEKAMTRLKEAEEKLKALKEAEEKSKSNVTGTGSRAVSIPQRILDGLMKAAREKAAAESGKSAEDGNSSESQIPEKGVPQAEQVQQKTGDNP
ncbi:MAG: hypothetical protein U0996_01730 [Planctomycetaceae bacterium]